MKAIKCTDPVPEDVIYDILVRLPGKPLSRFKSVSQSWLVIIRSPGFIRDHFRRKSNCAGLLVCLSSALLGPDIDHGDQEFENPDDMYAFTLFPDATSERHEFANHRELLEIRTIYGMYGPSYGIYCVFLKDSIALWNPATKTLRRVPDCPINGNVGLGIDRLTEDLKLVVIDGGCEKPDFAIYSLTANSWELLEDNALVDPGAQLEREKFGFTFSNGFCYWKKQKSYEHFSIVAFDIHNQTFQEIEMPEVTIDSSMEEKYVEMYDGVYDTLEEVFDIRMYIKEVVRDKMKKKLHWYDDSLAVVYCHHFAEEVRCDLWLMKDNCCWNKISTINLPFLPLTAFGVWSMNHIMAWSADSVSESKVFHYNGDSGCTTSLEFHIPQNVVLNSFLVPFAYKESLVTL